MLVFTIDIGSSDRSIIASSSMDPDGYTSYRSSSTVLGEGVFQFLRGSVYGAVWSVITPFPAPGSPAALAGMLRRMSTAWFKHWRKPQIWRLLNYFHTEISTGVFRPAPPFSSIKTLPTNAIMFGTVLAVQSVSCKSLELVRRREDGWNQLFGFAVAYRYYTYFLGSSEKRLIRHNRIVGGGLVAAIIYANFLVWRCT